MAVGSGIQILLRFLPQQFEKLQSWYYSWEGSMKYAIKIASGGMIFIPSYVNIAVHAFKFFREGIQMQRHRHKEQGNLIKLVLFSENRESVLKKMIASSLP
jgi:hypothetical protein